MQRKINWLTISIVFILFSTVFLPVVLAVNSDRIDGFDKGLSYLPVVPLKNVVLVDYDENSYLDDYAYLAAVPTAVFQDNDRLFSYPLLFYQDPYPVEEERERSLNARQGLDYFMEDWMSYCNGRLDQMTLINVPKSKLDSSWKARDYTVIEGDDPYSIASEIALNDWSYSDDAVIAVIGKEFEKPDNFTSSTIGGKIPADKEIIQTTFYSGQLDKLNPRFHEFDVPEGYKYLKSRTWWASFEVGTPSDSALPVGVHVAIPTADPDSQLYCRYNGEWMEASITQGWNIGGMDLEKAETYVYTSGPWRLGITDVPTHATGKFVTIYGTFIDILRNMIKGTTYQTDITMYPGVEIDIPVKTCFGCRDANFKLTWSDPNIRLGFSIIGPSGEEILSASDEDIDYQEIHFDQLGECNSDESYSVSIFTLDDVSSPVDFKVDFSWRQNFSRMQTDALTSATEGAVLASILNAPLLYTSASKLSQTTTDTLYKLGVKNIYLVNLGGHLSSKAKEEIGEVADIKKHYKESKEIYKAIMDITDQNDIIFSTIDPWSYWYVRDKTPSDKTEAGLFIGPAAYCAAHHGSPVLIIDNHPEFSSAVVWHTEFWKRYAKGFQEPSVAEMYLTGTRVYNFLKKLGYDKEGMESMITVADQWEVGATWDRTFTGKAKPGRIWGHPVDAAYWISRNVFYSALIFNNPGLNPEGVTMIQGSTSERRKLFPWLKFGLKIVKPSQDEVFKYPVIQLYVCYEHYFNEATEKYYGFQYKSADDIIPGVTESFSPIDDGIVPGKEGAIWPDLSMSEVIPFYLEKGGYGNVFSTNPVALTSNLNKGAILLVTSTHGSSGNSGLFQVWDPENSNLGQFVPDIIFNRIGYSKETNPWRGYDWVLGSTENPDTLTMEVHGFLPALLGNPDLQGLFPVGEDFWPSERPILHGLANLPIIKWFMPAWLKDSSYYKDGMVIAHTVGSGAVSYINGIQLDDALDNIYSVGWLNTACLPAYNYMHLTMIRHGSVFQVIDPWSTSWYGSFWSQSIPKDIVLGDTIGEAYTKGMSHVGILYLTDPPQWWWDILNNVCFFGDPDLRVFVPDTQYSDANYWVKEDTKSLRYEEDVSINGHMPYGATSYPNERTPSMFWEQYLLWILVIIIIIIILIAAAAVSRRKKK